METNKKEQNIFTIYTKNDLCGRDMRSLSVGIRETFLREINFYYFASY